MRPSDPEGVYEAAGVYRDGWWCGGSVAAGGACTARRADAAHRLPEDDANMKARVAALRQGLERRGWSDGRNIRIDYRHAQSCTGVGERACCLAARRTRRAHTVTPAAALQRQTRVFVSIGDPIGSGFINSFSRPGENFTCLTTFEPSSAGHFHGDLWRSPRCTGGAASSADGVCFRIPRFRRRPDVLRHGPR
jgi:hypothetical protein